MLKWSQILTVCVEKSQKDSRFNVQMPFLFQWMAFLFLKKKEQQKQTLNKESWVISTQPIFIIFQPLYSPVFFKWGY